VLDISFSASELILIFVSALDVLYHLVVGGCSREHGLQDKHLKFVRCKRCRNSEAYVTQGFEETTKVSEEGQDVVTLPAHFLRGEINHDLDANDLVLARRPVVPTAHLWRAHAVRNELGAVGKAELNPLGLIAQFVRLDLRVDELGLFLVKLLVEDP
jgi:hypothetical protein